MLGEKWFVGFLAYSFAVSQFSPFLLWRIYFKECCLKKINAFFVLFCLSLFYFEVFSWQENRYKEICSSYEKLKLSIFRKNISAVFSLIFPVKLCLMGFRRFLSLNCNKDCGHETLLLCCAISCEYKMFRNHKTWWELRLLRGKGYPYIP